VSIFKDIVAGLAEPVTDLISEAITDKDKAAELAHQITTMIANNAHAQVIGQLAINKAEAESESLFKGGWRPAAGWCCVAGMAINFLVIPLFGPILDAYTKMNMEPLDLTVMLPVLLGMLGLGGLRTIDKKNGVAS
jgi:Holin of 3TMs, for gene-transfer release